MNETETAVFEAKYHYLFWRPITAIRNGDRDDNAATERDADWAPLIVDTRNAMAGIPVGPAKVWKA